MSCLLFKWMAVFFLFNFHHELLSELQTLMSSLFSSSTGTKKLKAKKSKERFGAAMLHAVL